MYKVSHLRQPTLFISGLSDTLVPPRMMAELHGRCGSERKQLLTIPSGTHNETWTLHGYYHSIAVFLQNCRLQRPCSPRKSTSIVVNINTNQTRSKIHDV